MILQGYITVIWIDGIFVFSVKGKGHNLSDVLNFTCGIEFFYGVQNEGGREKLIAEIPEICFQGNGWGERIVINHTTS